MISSEIPTNGKRKNKKKYSKHFAKSSGFSSFSVESLGFTAKIVKFQYAVPPRYEGARKFLTVQLGKRHRYFYHFLTAISETCIFNGN